MSWERVRGHDAQVQAFDRAVAPRPAGPRLPLHRPARRRQAPVRRTSWPRRCCARERRRRPAATPATAAPPALMVDASTHPDFFAVSRPRSSNELPIEVMRELCPASALKSARGRGKVAVLDDADDLNEASANCFLKTLEEPPPRSVFILIGTSTRAAAADDRLALPGGPLRAAARAAGGRAVAERRNCPTRR